MKLMEGKKGVIFGVSNTHGIAYAIAKQLHDAGADIAFTYAGEAMEKRVRPIAEDMGAKIIMSCDVTKDDEVAAVFKECERVYGKLDFVVHAVAFAAKEDLQGRFIDTSRAGWDLALGVSAYSSLCSKIYFGAIAPDTNLFTYSLIFLFTSTFNYEHL